MDNKSYPLEHQLSLAAFFQATFPQAISKYGLGVAPRVTGGQ